jgi:hypothetical protein
VYRRLSQCTSSVADADFFTMHVREGTLSLWRSPWLGLKVRGRLDLYGPGALGCLGDGRPGSRGVRQADCEESVDHGHARVRK